MAKSVLSEKGYDVKINTEAQLEIINAEAINKPDTIATLMVNAGCPPTLLKVVEEDLESYFLRTIGMKGGVK